MYLYLIQHALSKSSDEDPERGLTDAGFAEIKKSSEFFRKLNPDISKIWHSGKKRAKQTASVLAENLNLDSGAVVAEHSNLKPMDDVSLAADELEKIENNIVIVGHLPHLSKLAAKLLTGQVEGEVVRFKNAGIVCLYRDNNLWRLEWYITPDILMS